MKTLILLASGQNWPNALSFFHYKGEGFDRVMIYATPAMAGSGSALKALIERHSFTCTVHAAPNNSSSALIEFIGGIEGELIANMTGGLKLFWLAMPVLLERGATIIYREIGDKAWYRITGEGEERFEELTRAERMEVDGLPLVINLQLQESKVCIDEQAEEHANESIETLIQKWPNRAGGATRFEELTLKALRLCGMHAKKILIKASGDQRMLDADVFAVSGSKPFLFECKLISSEQADAIDVISKLALKAKNFGGLNAKAVLAIPNWSMGPAPLELARHEAIEVWGPAEMRTFFSRILELSGSSDPDLPVLCGSLDLALAQQLDAVAGVEDPVFDYSKSMSRLIDHLKTTHRVGGAVHIPLGGKSLCLDTSGAVRGGATMDGKMSGLEQRLKNGQPLACLLPEHFFICVPAALANPNKGLLGRGKEVRILVGQRRDLGVREPWETDDDYDARCRLALRHKLDECVIGSAL